MSGKKEGIGAEVKQRIISTVYMPSYHEDFRFSLTSLHFNVSTNGRKAISA